MWTRLWILPFSIWLTACAPVLSTVPSSLTDPVPESDVVPGTCRSAIVWGGENLEGLRLANGKLIAIGRVVGNDCAGEGCSE